MGYSTPWVSMVRVSLCVLAVAAGLSRPALGQSGAPVLQYVIGHASMDHVVLQFSAALETASASKPGNYLVGQGTSSLIVQAAALSKDQKRVTLTTEAQIEGEIYELTVGNVRGATGVPVTGNKQASFRAFVFTPGLLKFEAYDVPGTDIQDRSITALIDHANYPDHPNEVAYLRAFTTTYAHPDSRHDNYGTRMTGVFVAPQTGNYIFYLRSDDASQLWFNPGGISETGKVLIAEETQCCHLFGDHASAAQTLVKGRRYYIESLHREGPEEDYCQVAVKLETAPDDPQFLFPINWQNLGIYADPTAATLAADGAHTVVALLPPGADTPVEYSQDLEADDGGFTVASVNPQGPWAYNAQRKSWVATSHEGCTQEESSTLTVPDLTIATGGEVLLVLRHRYNFEYRDVAYDGGQIRLGINGAATKSLAAGAFIAHGYTGIVQGNNLLKSFEAFTGSTPTHQSGLYITTVASLGTLQAGDTVALQFVAASDPCGRGLYPQWEIKQLELTHSVAKIEVNASGSAAGDDALPVGYNWSIDSGSGFVDTGSIDDIYWFVPTQADDQKQFRALLSIPGKRANSAVVTLRVTHEADCQIGGPYVATCDPAGAGLMVALNAGASSDPDLESITYAWSTDCSGATFSDPASPAPTLRFGPGFAPATHCDVSLALTDLAGATVTCASSVDTSLSLQRPSLALQDGDLSFECAGSSNVYIDPGAVATDACQNALEARTTGAAPDTRLPGAYVVTYSAIDVFGNLSDPFSRTVRVQDTVAPTISTCATPVEIEAQAGCMGVMPDLRGGMVAEDGCTPAGALLTTQEPPPGESLGLGTHTVKFTVVDAASGQMANCNTTVTVTAADDNSNGVPDCDDPTDPGPDPGGDPQPQVDGSENGGGCGSPACGPSGSLSLAAMAFGMLGLRGVFSRRLDGRY